MLVTVVENKRVGIFFDIFTVLSYMSMKTITYLVAYNPYFTSSYQLTLRNYRETFEK